MPNLVRQEVFSGILNAKWELKAQDVDKPSLYVERLISFVNDFKDKLQSEGGGCLPEIS